jgi:hypothetical protein
MKRREFITVAWPLATRAQQAALLIDAGLATAHTERMMAGGRPIEITHVRITEAGRRALADQPRG